MRFLLHLFGILFQKRTKKKNGRFQLFTEIWLFESRPQQFSMVRTKRLLEAWQNVLAPGKQYDTTESKCRVEINRMSAGSNHYNLKAQQGPDY